MHGNPPPPPYAMLNNPNGAYYPPPQYYPPAPYRKKSSGGCAKSCCRCICCCCCFLLLIFLIQLFSIIYFYHIYDPKIPSYQLGNINVNAFQMRPDSTVTTDLRITIRAENPNKHIGFVYGPDNFVVIEYSDTTLSAGTLPAFQQGPQNTTILDVELTGQPKVGPEIQHRFMDDEKHQMIPVMVKMKVPVNIVLDNVPLREFRIFVNCSMVLDSLSPNKTAHIIAKDTTFAVEF